MTPSPPPPEAVALRSVHMQSFPTLLRELGASLLVTTDQAGKLVVVCADGELLNTHFRVFPRPMGLAAQRDRCAIGTQRSVEEYQNLPAVAAKLDPPGKHETCSCRGGPTPPATSTCTRWTMPPTGNCG